MKPDCDLFCRVVDNYGDIGVCWRLTKCLRDEGLAVRLWVDDLDSFARLCPELDPTQEQQVFRDVEVRHWQPAFPSVEPAGLVIEAFDCKLPPGFLGAMAELAKPPVWINLEYLSAEGWVEGCHGMPSPHPTLPLTRRFFFPGFTPKTGGLLLERGLPERRDAFQQDAQSIARFWGSLGLPAPQPGELRISLFGYENPAVSELLRAWSQGTQPVTCLIPQGRILPQVAGFFGCSDAAPGRCWRQGSLQAYVLPFVEQERYDHLLWACDVNFVRGEDSCVRAQWAAKPFVWHIYPQHDGVHMQKLQALGQRYGAGMPVDAARANASLWQAWNGEGDIRLAWAGFIAQQDAIKARARNWADELSGNNLALNLLAFYRRFA